GWFLSASEGAGRQRPRAWPPPVPSPEGRCGCGRSRTRRRPRPLILGSDARMDVRRIWSNVVEENAQTRQRDGPRSRHALPCRAVLCIKGILILNNVWPEGKRELGKSSIFSGPPAGGRNSRAGPGRNGPARGTGAGPTGYYGPG